MEWRDIDAPYEVSFAGDLRNKLTGRVLRTQPDSRGKYRLWRGRLVHRIVALAFCPNPMNAPDVNHKNGNKMDNRAENLEWVTRSQNTQHAYATGLIPTTKGFCIPRKVYLRRDEEMREFDSVSSSAEFLGVSQTAVSNCLYGRSKSCGGWIASFSPPINEVSS